MMSVNQPTLY